MSVDFGEDRLRERAVSYTHLDVYKRQAYTMMKFVTNFYLIGNFCTLNCRNSALVWKARVMFRALIAVAAASVYQ